MQAKENEVSAGKISCPHCGNHLSEVEVRSILGQFARSDQFGFVRGNRFAKLTPEQRSEEARKAGKARWAKRAKASEVAAF